jgi:hypothetical protein
VDFQSDYGLELGVSGDGFLGGGGHEVEIIKRLRGAAECTRALTTKDTKVHEGKLRILGSAYVLVHQDLEE